MSHFQTFLNSKTFVFIIAFALGGFCYFAYLYIKDVQNKKLLSDKLRDVINDYIKKGLITVAEYGVLLRLVRQIGNYLGIYTQHVEKELREFGQHGDLDFVDGAFNEKEENKESKNGLDFLLQENLSLKNQLIENEEKLRLKQNNNNDKNEIIVVNSKDKKN